MRFVYWWMGHGAQPTGAPPLKSLDADRYREFRLFAVKLLARKDVSLHGKN
jgi:hypothetical protein